MTVTSPSTADTVPTDLVTLTIDGFEVAVPKGTLVIRAAELLGIQIPRFCDHPLLDPVGACRQCIVEVEGQRKPLASCTTTVTEGMVVKTQLTSPVAKKAQEGTLELLLINHPLDCPVCDKGGECPLQNQTMTNGNAESRFHDVKRTYPKPIAISSQVLLDRERCVLCARCTRFSQQVAGDPFIELFERGALQQVAIYSDQPFESYFSGNTVQICPVGALTGAAYRFRARPFDLVSSPMVCEHCASGCALRTDHRRGKVLRRLAGDDPQVNEEWNCDKGRWAFTYAAQGDRIASPLVRDYETGRLREASWTEALERAARGLALARARARRRRAARRSPDRRGRLRLRQVRPRRPRHERRRRARAPALRRGAGVPRRPRRRALRRPARRRHLRRPRGGAHGAARRLRAGGGVADRLPAPAQGGPPHAARASSRSRRSARPGAVKTAARLLPTAPGHEAEVLTSLLGGATGTAAEAGHRAGRAGRGHPGRGAARRHAPVRCRRPAGSPPPPAPASRGSRAGRGSAAPSTPVRCPACSRAAGRSPTRPTWPTSGARCRRSRVATSTASSPPPATAACPGSSSAPSTRPTAPTRGSRSTPSTRVPFLVSLELRRSPVTDRADVVLPVAAAVEKAGTYLDWEGRARPFDAVLHRVGGLTDGRVLHVLADELDRPLGLPDVASARAEISRLGAVTTRAAAPAHDAAITPTAGAGEALLASWHWLLDDGSLQDGEPFLAGTAKRPRLHLSAATAAEIGATEGGPVTVSSERGSLTLPLVIAEMPDRVVWVPMRTPDAAVRRDLAVLPGSVVRIAAAAVTATGQDGAVA